MNILIAFDDGYVLPTRVMLKSLIANNPHVELSIYVLYFQLKKESIESIYDICKNKRVNINFIRINENDFCFPEGGYITKETSIRLYAQHYLDNNLERILWLDGDMIVNGSLVDYYEQDFDGNLYIADVDYWMSTHEDRHEELEIPEEFDYVNAGVLLINLKEIRNTITNEEISQYINKHLEILRYNDQDVLNGLYYSRIKRVDPECLYNYYSWRITFKNKKQILKDARIIHYLTSYKPWKKGYKFHGFSLWWKYALKDDIKLLKLFVGVFPSHLRIRGWRIVKKMSSLLHLT